MKQISLGLNLSTKKTRKREFLEQMDKVVPWAVLVEIVAPHYSQAKTGRPPFPIETMLRIHYLQQWFGLSDPAMEEALHDVPLYREFAKLDGVRSRLPDESTILRFRHLLEEHKAGPRHAARGERFAQPQRPAAQVRHGGGCHLDQCPQLDQERQGRNATRRCTKPRKATSGTSA